MMGESAVTDKKHNEIGESAERNVQHGASENSSEKGKGNNDDENGNSLEVEVTNVTGQEKDVVNGVNTDSMEKDELGDQNDMLPEEEGKGEDHWLDDDEPKPLQIITLSGDINMSGVPPPQKAPIPLTENKDPPMIYLPTIGKDINTSHKNPPKDPSLEDRETSEDVPFTGDIVIPSIPPVPAIPTPRRDADSVQYAPLAGDTDAPSMPSAWRNLTPAQGTPNTGHIAMPSTPLPQRDLEPTYGTSLQNNIVEPSIPPPLCSNATHPSLFVSHLINTIPNVDDEKNLDPSMLRIVARMFRQHANLFLKQASALEKMSAHPNDPSRWDVDSINVHTREELEDKLRRESVVDLAKKSWEGMTRLQKRLDSLQHIISERGYLAKRQYEFQALLRRKREKTGYDLFKDELSDRYIHMKEAERKKLDSPSFSKEVEDVSATLNSNIPVLEVEWEKLTEEEKEVYSKEAENGQSGFELYRANFAKKFIGKKIANTPNRGKTVNTPNRSKSNITGVVMPVLKEEWEKLTEEEREIYNKRAKREWRDEILNYNYEGKKEGKKMIKKKRPKHFFFSSKKRRQKENARKDRSKFYRTDRVYGKDIFLGSDSSVDMECPNFYHRLFDLSHKKTGNESQDEEENKGSDADDNIYVSAVARNEKKNREIAKVSLDRRKSGKLSGGKKKSKISLSSVQTTKKEDRHDLNDDDNVTNYGLNKKVKNQNRGEFGGDDNGSLSNNEQIAAAPSASSRTPMKRDRDELDDDDDDSASAFNNYNPKPALSSAPGRTSLKRDRDELDDDGSNDYSLDYERKSKLSPAPTKPSVKRDRDELDDDSDGSDSSFGNNRNSALSSAPAKVSKSRDRDELDEYSDGSDSSFGNHRNSTLSSAPAKVSMKRDRDELDEHSDGSDSSFGNDKNSTLSSAPVKLSVKQDRDELDEDSDEMKFMNF